jgi:hypothetical protein
LGGPNEARNINLFCRRSAFPFDLHGLFAYRRCEPAGRADAEPMIRRLEPLAIGGGGKTVLDVISPELVLVDPELARRARKALPEPTSTVTRREIEPVLTAPRPTVVRAPAVEPPSRRQRGATVRVGMRLLAAATLVPVLVGLALVGDFVASGEPSLDRGSSPSADRPRPDGARPAPQQPPAQSSRAKPRSSNAASAASHRPAPRSHAVAAPQSGKASAPPHSRPSGAVERLAKTIGTLPGSLARTFGRPSRRTRNGQYCNIGWAGRGMTIVLVAGQAKNPCTSGRATGGVATARRWHTAKGLAVGASLAELRRRYPTARNVGSDWWKLGSIRNSRSKEAIPLHAHVRDGRVDKLLVN